MMISVRVNVDRKIHLTWKIGKIEIRFHNKVIVNYLYKRTSFQFRHDLNKCSIMVVN